MSKMSSHDPFGHLKHKLWPKESRGVKLVVWLLATKSQESTRFSCVEVACDIPLESSQWGLELCFKNISIEGFHANGNLNFGNFDTPIWKSQDKMSFGCGSRQEAHNIRGKVVASPKFGPWWVLWIRVARGSS